MHYQELSSDQLSTLKYGQWPCEPMRIWWSWHYITVIIAAIIIIMALHNHCVGFTPSACWLRVIIMLSPRHPRVASTSWLHIVIVAPHRHHGSTSSSWLHVIIIARHHHYHGSTLSLSWIHPIIIVAPSSSSPPEAGGCTSKHLSRTDFLVTCIVAYASENDTQRAVGFYSPKRLDVILNRLESNFRLRVASVGNNISRLVTFHPYHLRVPQDTKNPHLI